MIRTPQTNICTKANANGVSSSSPRLRGPRYLGTDPQIRNNPIGVESAEVGRDATPVGVDGVMDLFPRQALLRRANLGLNDGTPLAFICAAPRDMPYDFLVARAEIAMLRGSP